MLFRSGSGLSENFDSVTPPNLPAGWTTNGSPAWTTANALSDSPPNSAFAPNVNNENTSLTSPMFTAVDPTLTFRHRYDLESCCDFGKLEIAIGGGAFQDIISAGGSFVGGGYNNFSGWSGNSGGYITTTVTLPPAALGQSVQLRWHLTADSSVTYTGWYVDTINAGIVVPPVVTVGQNSGPYSQPNIATNLSVGPANESGQVLNFIVTNNNNALFSSQPVVSAAGTLSFTPAANVAGSALVSVQIHDDAGVLNGGVDTSASQTFTILVVPRPVLSPPVFTNLTNVLLSWSSISGGVYRLQYLPALAPTNASNWLTLAGDVTATGNFSSKVHTNGQGAGTNRMFYRVLMP